MPARPAGKLVWEPSATDVERALLTRYMRWLAAERGRSFAGYHDLWEWSVARPEEFWASIWDHFGVHSEMPFAAVLGRREMPGAEWFPGARLSYADHLFRGKPGDRVAVVEASELRPTREWTWGELRVLTAALAGGLRTIGVERGDRVAGYLPNVPETVAAFLACASIGAVWSCCPPEFGARSVTDRLAQIEPRVLLAADGYRYGGKDYDRTATVAELRHAMPSVERTVLLPYLGVGAALEGAIGWDELVGMGAGATLAPVAVPFDHPLWVLYSSGTTGLPKAIVHGHGGILLEHLKKAHLHLDAQPGDRLFWFTTTGWMMWNFLVGVLLSDAAIVLYDGSPALRRMGILWDVAAETRMTCFGTSAAYVGACMKAGVAPAEGRDLDRLRAVGSTGSPLSPEAFGWIYDELGAQTWLFSTSGGTDVCSAFVGGVPTLPVYQGELQARSLGAKVEAFDESGRPLVGEVGELVLTEPLPSMPVFLWGDDHEMSRYRETYFDRYPGVWRHGDWIEITDRGTAVIYGRSDATINRGGVRMGTSEIYRVVLDVPQVIDALVVDIPRPGTDGWMPLFVVLRDGEELDAALTAEIRRRIREDCSPRHVPDEIRRIPAVPRTLSGKALEVPVKRILTGTPAGEAASRESLANPEALDWFVELAGAMRA